jgi:hypothetical protein
MSHYSDCYDYEHEQEQINKKLNLESQLEDLQNFYMWKPNRVRTWSWNGQVDKLYQQMIQEIKAQLYDLRDI